MVDLQQVWQASSAGAVSRNQPRLKLNTSKTTHPIGCFGDWKKTVIVVFQSDSIVQLQHVSLIEDDKAKEKKARFQTPLRLLNLSVQFSSSTSLGRV